MPYSCWMTAMSLWLSNSELAATDVADPLTSSPMTRGLREGDPSATRTTLTSAPFADKPSERAALNVASPHGVGGCVLRMPKLGEAKEPCPDEPAREVDDLRAERAFKVIPTCGCHRRVRRERLLGEISGGQLISIPDWLGSQRYSRYTQWSATAD